MRIGPFANDLVVHDSDEGRSARNQAVFRAGNEAIKANVGDADALLLVCECGEPSCFERVALKPVEYERIRSSPRRFVVAPGHEMQGADEALVIEESERFVVLEKLGASGAIAEELQPRGGAEG